MEEAPVPLFHMLIVLWRLARAVLEGLASFIDGTVEIWAIPLTAVIIALILSTKKKH